MHVGLMEKKDLKVSSGRGIEQPPPPPTTKNDWSKTFDKNRPPKNIKKKHKVVLGTFLLLLFVDA